MDVAANGKKSKSAKRAETLRSETSVGVGREQ